ncbi:MAG: hypothetical protein NT162_02020 [Candidatus Woesebacteria bacterium]|nr:hypothetical protein [Candidatus Woesebacteria bacterium]
MSKRRRFVVTSALLSLGFIAIQFLNDQNRFWAIGALGVLTVVLFYWSLRESLGRKMTLLTLVLPTIFTLGVGVFWFLLPANVFARIPIVIFYGLGIYVLCLTANIYSVASVRTIALLRAARGVGFVLSLLTSFLVFDAILSIKSELFILLPLVFIVSFFLYLQGFWSMLLEVDYSRDLVILSGVSALLTTEVAAALYFWPVTVVVGSLFLTVTLYMLLGLGQAKVDGRLFSSTVREHLVVGVLVFVAMFFATHWGG